MEKTPQEITDAVLAYCHEVCPPSTKGPVTIGHVTLEWIDYGTTMNSGLRLYGVVDWMYIDESMGEYVASHAYRLLGLEKRDALEAARGKAAQEVKDERKRIEDYGMSLIEQVDPSVQEDVMRPIFEAAYAKGLRDGASGLSVVMLQNVALNIEREKSKRWESRTWKILEIVRRRENEQRPKTAAVLRTLREVSEKTEGLVAQLEEIKYEDEVNGKGWENNHNSTYSRLCRVLEAYKEGKKDE